MLEFDSSASAETPSRRTRHAEMLRLCARIGYSPPAFFRTAPSLRD